MESVFVCLQCHNVSLPITNTINKNKSLITNNGIQNRRLFFTHSKLFCGIPRLSTSLSFNPLHKGFYVKRNEAMVKRKGRGYGVVCYATGPITTRNLQLISTISSVILAFAGGTGIHKSLLVPLFALQAPAGVISWIKGEYGIWTAFLAVLVRLFFFLPGELDLPFMAFLLVILAPPQVMRLRGTQQGAIIALVMAGYLAFQQFSRIGNMQRAFQQGSLVATLAIICLTVISVLLLL